MMMMIESYVIELLDIGDSAQSMDTYSRKSLMKITSFFRLLHKYKHISLIFDVLLLMIFFVQIWAISLIHVPCKGDLLLEIIDYLKKVILFFEIITNKSNYITVFSITFSFIFLNSILMTIVLFTNGIYNL